MGMALNRALGTEGICDNPGQYCVKLVVDMNYVWSHLSLE